MRASTLLRLLIGLAVLAAPSRVRAQSGAPPTDSVAAATRQLELGEQWFNSACVECHATRALTSADFRLKWGGRNAFDLFELIRSTMPDSKPGTLTQGTYAAIVAYLLKLNGMAVGTQRLSADSGALVSIRLTFPSSSSTTPR